MEPKNYLKIVWILPTRLAIIVSLMTILLSCTQKETKRDNRWLELVQDIEKIQKQLPRQLEDGMTLVRAEYEDSIYSTWVEIDEKGISFEEMSGMLEKRRREILDDVSISEGNDRRNYEMYVEFNIRTRMVYYGKTSNKQIEFTITPSEINEALHSKADAYKRLQMLINSVKTAATESMEGMSTPVLFLKDSTVYITIKLDEDLYEIKGMNNEEKEITKTEIMAEMRGVNPRLIRFMADANCSLCYRVIGSRSEKGFDIEISSNEVFLNKIILDADEKTRLEIVESDE